MDAINQALLIAGILLLVAIALSAASQRVGIPSLLVFLAVGLLATELPGAPAVSIEPQTAALVGNLALAVILLDGGLRTRLAAYRMGAAPAPRRDWTCRRQNTSRAEEANRPKTRIDRLPFRRRGSHPGAAEVPKRRACKVEYYYYRPAEKFERTLTGL